MLSREEIFRHGSELRRIMNSDAFQAAVDLQKETYQNTFFTSSFAEAHRREEAYKLNAALDDLIATMNTLAIAAEYDAMNSGED